MDPTKPPLTILQKLGAITVAARDAAGSLANGAALEALTRDPEIEEWVEAMGSLLPAPQQ